MPQERWEEIPEFPDYAVNNLGEIANMKTGLPRRTSINQQGIVKISLYRGRELHTRSVAVLVAEAFCEGRDLVFDTPIHLDGDRENCRADNLMWRPRWFAVKYHRQFYIDSFHNSEVSIVEKKSGVRYDSVKDACMDLGIYFDDVYRSYLYDIPVPLLWHEFRLA